MPLEINDLIEVSFMTALTICTQSKIPCIMLRIECCSFEDAYVTRKFCYKKCFAVVQRNIFS